jgi:phosphatidate phosphatase PAH1
MHAVIFKISGMKKIWSAHTYFWANVYIVLLDDSDAILTETLPFFASVFQKC